MKARVPYWLRDHGVDLLIVSLAIATVIELAVTTANVDKGIVLPLSMFFVLPLLARRRLPLIAPAFALAAVVLAVVLDPNGLEKTTTPFFAALASTIAFGAIPDRRKAAAGWVGAMATVTAVSLAQPTGGIDDIAWLGFFFTAAWLVGFGTATRTQQTRELRARVEHAEEQRERLAQEAVAEERARIARELHDVIAHSVSVMVVQAAGVRRLLTTEQEREREALLVVERTGRQALTEMRRMLGVLREGDDAAARAPAPGLQHLDRLVEQVRNAGVNVDLRVDGEPIELPPGLDLSAYRIVQESLANTVRRPGSGGAHVRIRYAPEELELDVIDDNGNGGGEERLAGLRERVAVYGGRLEVGPGPDGGFRIRAHLPLAGVRT